MPSVVEVPLLTFKLHVFVSFQTQTELKVKFRVLGAAQSFLQELQVLSYAPSRSRIVSVRFRRGLVSFARSDHLTKRSESVKAFRSPVHSYGCLCSAALDVLPVHPEFMSQYTQAPSASEKPITGA